MYRGFRRSRIVMGVTLALTVALTVFVWMRNRGRAVYIPVLASVLLLGIGCTAPCVFQAVCTLCGVRAVFLFCPVQENAALDRIVVRRFFWVPILRRFYK